MAAHLGINDEEIEFVRLGGILHDIGKIGFPDVLFQAHENKNPSEIVKEIIKHPTTGAEILKDLYFLGRKKIAMTKKSNILSLSIFPLFDA